MVAQLDLTNLDSVKAGLTCLISQQKSIAVEDIEIENVLSYMSCKAPRLVMSSADVLAIYSSHVVTETKACLGVVWHTSSSHMAAETEEGKYDSSGSTCTACTASRIAVQVCLEQCLKGRGKYVETVLDMTDLCTLTAGLKGLISEKKAVAKEEIEIDTITCRQIGPYQHLKKGIENTTDVIYIFSSFKGKKKLPRLNVTWRTLKDTSARDDIGQSTTLECRSGIADMTSQQDIPVDLACNLVVRKSMADMTGQQDIPVDLACNLVARKSMVDMTSQDSPVDVACHLVAKESMVDMTIQDIPLDSNQDMTVDCRQSTADKASQDIPLDSSQAMAVDCRQSTADKASQDIPLDSSQAMTVDCRQSTGDKASQAMALWTHTVISEMLCETSHKEVDISNTDVHSRTHFPVKLEVYQEKKQNRTRFNTVVDITNIYTLKERLTAAISNKKAIAAENVEIIHVQCIFPLRVIQSHTDLLYLDTWFKGGNKSPCLRVDFRKYDANAGVKINVGAAMSMAGTCQPALPDKCITKVVIYTELNLILKPKKTAIGIETLLDLTSIETVQNGIKTFLADQYCVPEEEVAVSYIVHYNIRREPTRSRVKISMRRHLKTSPDIISVLSEYNITGQVNLGVEWKRIKLEQGTDTNSFSQDFDDSNSNRECWLASMDMQREKNKRNSASSKKSKSREPSNPEVHIATLSPTSDDLIKRLQSLWVEESLCDVTLMCAGMIEEKAHRVILASQSAMFIDDAAYKALRGVYDFSDIQPEIMNLVLGYMYCKPVKLLSSNISALRLLAAKLDMNALVEACDGYINDVKVTQDDDADMREDADRDTECDVLVKDENVDTDFATETVMGSDTCFFQAECKAGGEGDDKLSDREYDYLASYTHPDNDVEGESDESGIILKGRNKLKQATKRQNINKSAHQAKYRKTHYNCPECDKVYQRKQLMYQHMVKSHSDCQSLEHCKYCDKAFASKLKLQQHVKIHSKSLRHLEYRTKFVFTQKQKCTKCDKYFTNKDKMRSHMGGAHEQSMLYCEHKECNNIFMTADFDILERHLADDHQEVWRQCTMCEYRSVLWVRLFQHMLVHKEVKCLLCERTYRYTDRMLPHLKNQHRIVVQSRVLNCPTCEYQTYILDSLRHHMRQRHTQERPYKCDVCDRTFKEKW